MNASTSRRREVPFKAAAAVVVMVAVSFLAGERVGVAVANRATHSLAGEVVAAIAHAYAPAPDNAVPASAPDAADPPGPGADCNTNYR